MSTPPPLSRRTLIGGAVALGALPARLSASTSARLIVGDYVQEGGHGLTPLTSTPTGWRAGSAMATIRNASFGVWGTVSGIRYLLDEEADGALGVYDAELRLLKRVTTFGADPCHAALSPDGAMLAIANYSSGNVALWQLDRKTGLPVGNGASIPHQGSGPNADRQTGPHAHWVGFNRDGRLLHAVDLGADAIFAHRVDARSATVTDTRIAYRAAPGSGPRHLTHHPRLPVAYLVAELANMVTILRTKPDGTFETIDAVSTLPKGFSGESYAGHIAVNRAGTRLYVSNRGHDSIAVFAIGRDGGLTLTQHTGSGGVWPRLFLILEDRGEILVANQRSGNIGVLRIGKDGRLGRATPGPLVPGIAFIAT